MRVTVLIPIAHLPSHSPSLIFHFASVDRRREESSFDGIERSEKSYRAKRKYRRPEGYAAKVPRSIDKVPPPEVTCKSGKSFALIDT